MKHSSRCLRRSSVHLSLAAMLLAWPAGSLAQEAPRPLGDVNDSFFRFTGTENKPFFSELPGETVDPFTGTLHVVQQDLVLPGKGGHDLRVVRSYSSKLWGRSDLLDAEPFLALKDASVLGLGWSLHFGRLRNPWGTGSSTVCGGDFPVFEEPDGTSHVFYPAFDERGLHFVSREYWRLEQSCAPATICVWSSSGVRYELAPSSVDEHGQTRLNTFSIGSATVLPVTAVVDPFGNRISMTYLGSTGAPDYVTDTYGRTIRFSYSQDVDGLRLDALEANGKTFRYSYQALQPEEVVGHPGRWILPGRWRFLTEVAPPAGPSAFYDYAYDVPVANNQYALSTLTYPGGGATSYEYASVPFYTGRETVPFSVVSRRTVGGRGVTAGDWSYAYSSPAYGAYSSTLPGTTDPTDLHVTTITRPDGKQDTYAIYGFGWAANKNRGGFTYGVGLTYEAARADRAEVETFDWDARADSPVAAGVTYAAPVYSTNCGEHFLFDGGVYAPTMKHRWLQRGLATFETDYGDFDAYGQPRTVVETGYVSGLTGPIDPAVRTTSWSYFAAPFAPDGTTLNMVRGKPLTHHVCVDADCFDESWSYAEPGHPTHAATKSGVTTTFDHTSEGDLMRITNALGQTVDVHDYTWGVPTRIVLNGAYTTRRAVSWEGWTTAQTDARGNTTYTERDGIGRPTLVTPPGQNDATRYAYAADGSQVTASRGSGDRVYQATTFLDGLGRTEGTLDSLGVRTHTVYDAMGRTSFQSYPYDDALGEVGDRFELDGLGRVKVQTRAYRPALGECDVPGLCSIAFDYVGTCSGSTITRSRDELAISRKACTDSFGDPSEQRLAQVADPYGSLWQYGYSAAGSLTSVAAPLIQGNRSYEYDAHQFLVSETAPETGTIDYGRNAIGQMTTRTDARGVTATYHYDDPLGRLRRITYSRSSADDLTLDYDENGNVTETTTPNGGGYVYGYDELNRVTSQLWTFQGQTYQTSYHYDPAGCLDRIIYPSGAVVTMRCDLANRVTGMEVDGAALVSDVAYHPAGGVVGMRYGNGAVTTADFDDRGRMVTVTAPGVVDLHYTYDVLDSVKSLEDRTQAGSLRTMTYDRLDRLWIVTANELWGIGNYGYDELGNRTYKLLGSEVSYTYDEANRLEWSSAEWSGPPVKLTWDDAGRLASSSDGTTYRYDGSGRRVQKAEPGRTTVYHYDVAGRVIAETLPDGTKLRDYFYLGSKLLAVDGCIGDEAPPCMTRQWYHSDALGSPVARTDQSGAVVARLEYSPWGEEWDFTGDPGDRQYNGRVYDPGTGFHDYGARMYWPEIGRFVSADSYAGDIANPASLNRYSYVLNNPYRYTDPTGHSEEEKYISAKVLKAATKGSKWSVPEEVTGTYEAIEGTAKLIQAERAAGTGPKSGASEAPAGELPTITISRERFPKSAEHVDEAQAAGQPSVVTIDRSGAAARRRESLRGTKPDSQNDRDEYPGAMFQEGGAGASVRPVPKGDNRGAGASMGNQARRFPDGTRVRLVTGD